MGRLFCIAVDSEAESGAKYIQNQIINITAAYQRKQLKDLHGGDDGCGDQQHTQQGSTFGKDPGQQEAEGNKHDDIAAQIDDGSPDILRMRRVQQSCKQPQCPEGNQIQLAGHLLPVRDALHITGPVKEQPQHQGAVGHKQSGMDFAAAHGITPSVFRHYSRVRRKRQEKKALTKMV